MPTFTDFWFTTTALPAGYSGLTSHPVRYGTPTHFSVDVRLGRLPMTSQRRNWCILGYGLSKNTKKRGDAYRKLHDAKVPNLPELGTACDVSLSTLSPDHANTFPLAVQRTKTQDYLKGYRRCDEWCLGRPCVEPYVHYRLVTVVETLGQPLNTFKSTRQLCEAIRDTIVGKEWVSLFTSLLTEGSRQLTLRRTREPVYYIGISALQTF